MIRRVVAVLVMALAVGLLGGHVAGADPDGPGAEVGAVVYPSESATTSVPERIPATTLEAEARDDGTQPAPWLIGSAVAAGAVILVGGLVLKRRVR
ncbi:MAG: hypothetical protein ACT452_15210 [Microthrixaceae bacterium]